MRSLEELQILAEQGHDESQFMLGYMFATGKGTVKDVHRAKSWLEKAATANNPKAQYYLGELYNEAGKSDPSAAYVQMAYWWGKSASHPYWETMEGYDGRAISMRRLAWLQMHSGFEAANPEDALRLLEKLTTKFSSPRSAIELGIVYSAGSFMPLSKRLGGIPIQQDAVKGIRLIERGVLIIENSSNDIDYNLYSAIGDTYLMRSGDAPIAAEALHKGIIYKKKALDRAKGVNEDTVINLQNQIDSLEDKISPANRANLIQTAEPILDSPVDAVNNAPVAPLSSELAEKFAKFGEYFDGLEIEDKRDFIKNLDQKLQENPNPDYNAFLLQCIEKYNASNQEKKAHEQVAIHPSYEGENTAHAQRDFQSTEPVHKHQSEYNSESGYNHPRQDDYDDTDEPHPLGNYTDRIHTFGISSPFMVGTILYTIGSLLLPIILGIYIDHRLGFLGFAAVLFTIPPAIALWLIFIASKSPKPPEKSLTALTLFRLTFFIHLGVIAASATGLALRFGMDGQAFFNLSIFDSPLDLLLILVGLAVVVLYVTFYYGSLFSILKGIRDNIYANTFEPLTGIGPFNGIHNITSIVIIIGSIGVVVIGLTSLDFVSIPEIILIRFENANMALALIAVSLIISRIGGLISISVLRQFNNGLEYELEESEVLEEYS